MTDRMMPVPTDLAERLCALRQGLHPVGQGKYLAEDVRPILHAISDLASWTERIALDVTDWDDMDDDEIVARVRTATAMIEPDDFGARVTLHYYTGETERFLRAEDDKGAPVWLRPGKTNLTWVEMCERGRITAGWEDDD